MPVGFGPKRSGSANARPEPLGGRGVWRPAPVRLGNVVLIMAVDKTNADDLRGRCPWRELLELAHPRHLYLIVVW